MPVGQGVIDYFMAQLVRHGYLHEMNPALDEIRSEYPLVGSAAGMLSVAAGAAMSYQSFSMAIASGHLFHLGMLVLDNRQEAGAIHFYDGPGYSIKMFAWTPQQSTPDMLDGFKGVIFQSIPMASFNGSQLTMRIGGLIRERTGE